MSTYLERKRTERNHSRNEERGQILNSKFMLMFASATLSGSITLQLFYQVLWPTMFEKFEVQLSSVNCSYIYIYIYKRIFSSACHFYIYKFRVIFT